MLYRKTNELTKSKQQLQNHVIHQCEIPIQVMRGGRRVSDLLQDRVRRQGQAAGHCFFGDCR